MAEYKVIKTESDKLEAELNVHARENWRPVLISPAGFGGASWTNFGPSRVDTFCVVLERGLVVNPS